MNNTKDSLSVELEDIIIVIVVGKELKNIKDIKLCYILNENEKATRGVQNCTIGKVKSLLGDKRYIIEILYKEMGDITKFT